jgi:hypothetical protein
VIQETFGVIQGTFGVIQGTFGVIQGTFGVIQGTFGVIQGTFGVIQLTIHSTLNGKIEHWLWLESIACRLLGMYNDPNNFLKHESHRYTGWMNRALVREHCLQALRNV